MEAAQKEKAHSLVAKRENAQAQLPAQMVSLSEEDAEVEMVEEWEEELV